MEKAQRKGISIIIPTFNRIKYLYATLICLTSQIGTESVKHEIIIIDSGNDETESMITLFRNNTHSQIIYQKIQNCNNRSLLRNIGADLASFPILCFLDNDILVPSTFISTCYKGLANKQSVLMFYRKSLLQFDINSIGIEKLISNFKILDNLPWYDDVRRNVTISVNPWKYVYSHSIVIYKELFLNAGKFDKRFGVNWGFEDMDLGYRLYLLNVTFRMAENICVYHQPHFSQSNIEQNSGRKNYDLFLSLHNNYRIEIALSFYKDSIGVIGQLEKISRIQKINEDKYKDFDLILGCVISEENKKNSEKFRLGVTLPFTNDSKQRVLILHEFFFFNILLQNSIICEAFRVSKFVFIDYTNEKTEDYINKICSECGIAIIIKKEDQYFKCERLNFLKSSLYEWLLPQVFIPEKRGVYIWLANKNATKGKRSILIDIQNSESNRNNDFCTRKMHDSITWSKTAYGLMRTTKCFSYSLIQTESLLKIPDNENSIIFRDESFCNPRSENQLFTNSKIISRQEVAEINFLCAYETYTQVESRNEETKKNVYYCFMENGFYEDGIDLILKEYQVIEQLEDNAFLYIKIPDYEKIYLDSYPLHNLESKEQKIYTIKHRFEWELFQLQKALNQLKLRSKVKIKKQNLTLFQIALMLKKSRGLFHFSRGIYIPVEVYISMLFGHQTFIGQHHIIPKEIAAYFTVLESRNVYFPKALRIPATCDNSFFEAFEINVNSALSKNPMQIDKQYISSFYEKKKKELSEIV